MRFFVVTAHLRKSLSFLKPLQAESKSFICMKTHQVPFLSVLSFLAEYIRNFCVISSCSIYYKRQYKCSSPNHQHVHVFPLWIAPKYSMKKSTTDRSCLKCAYSMVKANCRNSKEKNWKYLQFKLFWFLYPTCGKKGWKSEMSF